LEKIKKELESFPLIKQGYSLDGELYIPGVSIGELRSVLGRKELNNQKVINIEKNIKYYIFDFFKNNEEIPFEKRLLKLQEAFNNWNSKLVQLTDTKIVKSLEDIKKSRNKFIENGYEGIIVRNKNGIYLHGKKSIDVFRSKEFKTNLFMIIGANEGKGNNKGTVIWELQCLNTKKTFTAKPIGTKEERTKLYNNRNKYIGLKIPIKYYDIDKNTGCVTRHPVALKISDL
jgi:DNA ligase-1